MSKIHVSRLKQIIREELGMIHEGEDHDAATKIMGAATKLLSAIESFKEAASEKVKAELTDLNSVESILKRVIASPMQYVDATKVPVKKVTLKAQTDKTL